jgi:hypothetical protein
MNDKKILQYVREMTRDNAQRAEGDFWDIHNDKTVCSWGWTVPMSYIVNYVTYRIVYLSFSPQHKGEQGGVLFDYITETEYRQGLSEGKGKK